MSGKRKASALDADQEEVPVHRSKRQCLSTSHNQTSQLDPEYEEVSSEHSKRQRLLTSESWASDLDPEYEDITAQQSKRQRLLEQDGENFTYSALHTLILNMGNNDVDLFSPLNPSAVLETDFSTEFILTKSVL